MRQCIPEHHFSSNFVQGTRSNRAKMPQWPFVLSAHLSSCIIDSLVPCRTPSDLRIYLHRPTHCTHLPILFQMVYLTHQSHVIWVSWSVASAATHTYAHGIIHLALVVQVTCFRKNIIIHSHMVFVVILLTHGSSHDNSYQLSCIRRYW